jgi:ABC-2 type transport system ATP-binding protein
MGIEVRQVDKRFGAKTALDAVSLRFESGRIYGLLGRNGAGKTTLLNVITNRLFADGGEVLVDGLPARENDAAQRKIYMMGESTLFSSSMGVRRAFETTALFYPGFDMSQALHMAEKFKLPVAKSIGSLSTGYATIFKCIAALASNVPYVLLDEPVLGLDANHRELFYRLLIEKYAQNPFTVVLSTHLIGEVEGIVEDVVVIDRGRILVSESLEKLLERGYAVTGPTDRVERFVAGQEVIGRERLGGVARAYVLGLPKEGGEELEISPMDLQKLFIELTRDREEA